jgi:hypothetical protein
LAQRKSSITRVRPCQVGKRLNEARKRISRSIQATGQTLEGLAVVGGGTVKARN